MTTQTKIHELVVRAKKGDRSAFGRLYREYFNKIYRYCRINVYRDELAEDVSQEVFIRAWKSLVSFSVTSDGTFQAYLFRIARNLIIDLSRKKREYPLDHAEEVECDDSPEDNLYREDIVSTIRLALARLREYDRHVVVLRYFEELPYVEISKIIGIKEGALRVRMNRILKVMKKMIAHHNE